VGLRQRELHHLLAYALMAHHKSILAIALVAFGYGY
jgi:hypothetical protein